MGIFLNNQIVINEVYFGKTKDIQELQHYLTQWRANAYSSRNIINQYNSDPWRMKFEDKMCDIFGFANYELLVVPEKIVNAYTYNIGIRFDITGGKLQKAVMTTKDGFKYDKSYKFSCITRVYEGIFLNDNINDNELLAIILHEIGHNFQEVMNEKSLAFTSIKKTIVIISHIISAISGNLQELVNLPFFMLDNTNAMSNINIKINRIIYNNKILSSIQNTKNYLNGKINSLFRWISLIMVIPNYIRIILGNIINSLNPLSIFLNSIQYNDEKLADSFATMYGYGDDLAKGLVKIEGLETKHYKNKKGEVYEYPLYIHLLNLVIMPINILFCASSPHPTITARLYNQIDYLEKEIKRNNIDPKMEKEIKKQIQDIKKIMQKDILEPGRNKDKADINMVSKMYYAYLYDKFEGGDYRNNIYKKTDLHKQIQDIYNDKRKK